jgi:hypothetical protein
LRVKLAAHQKLGVSEHPIQRRPDFVAHGGEELGLGFAGRLGRRSGFLEGCLRFLPDPQLAAQFQLIDNNGSNALRLASWSGDSAGRGT